MLQFRTVKHPKSGEHTLAILSCGHAMWAHKDFVRDGNRLILQPKHTHSFNVPKFRHFTLEFVAAGIANLLGMIPVVSKTK